MQDRSKEQFLGHPKGLYILFFTELWERFSFYGMKAILVLYMVAKVQDNSFGGFGWSDAKALAILGYYQLLVYVMSVPGGIIADKVLGQRKSVYIGGLLLCAGHFLLAYPPEWAFFSALGLIILGVGLLKPNISTMVGGLYPEGDSRKDAGFTIFYMGINVGAAIAGIAVGWLAQKYGWHWGFGLAGVGMLLGQGVYAYGQKYLGTAGLLKKTSAAEETKENKPLTALEKRRIGLILFSFFIVIIFWAAYEQAGGLLNLYTDRYTDRNLLGFEIPTAFFQSLNPVYIMILAPAAASFWVFLAKRKKEPSAIAKMGIGTVILGLGFIFMVGASLERGGDEAAKSNMIWLCLTYLFSTLGELALSPVSLSFITSMAPKRMTSLFMGLYFAVTGIAAYCASLIGSLADVLGELMVFALIAGFTVFFGALLMCLSKKVNKIADITE